MDGFSIGVGVVALLETAVSILQAIQKASKTVRSAPETLTKLSNDLDSLHKTLELVKAEPLLQSKEIEEALDGVIAEETRLQGFFETLSQKQQRHGMKRFISSLTDADGPDTELQVLVRGLNNARNNLALRIQVTQVGLIRDQNNGLRVAYDVLTRVDRHVKEVLGTGLTIARVLEDRSLQPPQGNIIQLTEADVKNIQDGLPPRAEEKEADTVRFRSRNVTVGHDSIVFEGDLGFEAVASTKPWNSVVDGVRMGNNSTMHRGNVSASVAGDFIKALYGNRAGTTSNSPSTGG